LRPGNYWVVASLILWLSILAVRAIGSLMPATDVWEGGNPFGVVVTALAVEPGQVLAGTFSGLYVSNDRGESWQVVPELADCDVTAVAARDGRAVAAGCEQLWSRAGGRWTGTSLEQGDVHHLLFAGESILIATDKGLFARKADDLSESRRLWPLPGEAPAAVNAVVAVESRLLLGTEDGLVQLDPESQRWREMGPSGKRVLGVDVGGGWIQVALGGPEGGLARSQAGAGEWQWGSVPSEYAQVVLVDPGDASRVYAGLWGLADEFNISGVVISEDAGATWEPLKSRLLNSFVPAIALETEGQLLYAGTNGGGIFRYAMPSLLDRVVQGSRPILDTMEPLLLGMVALTLLLRRRRPRS
jgi:hypothetical protein